MNKIIKWIVGLVVVVLVVWGGYVLYQKYGSNNGGTAKGGPIKIGFMGPLSGDAAAYGEPARNMTMMAVEEINANGGINGQPLEVVYEDSKCNGKDGASAAQKLVNVDGVKVIAGPFCSGESLAAVPVAEAGSVALLSPGASSPDLTGKSKFFSRNCPSDASQGKVLAEAAFNTKKWKNVVVIQEQTDYALGIFKAFSTNFEALGGKKVVKEEFATSVTDFRTQLSKLKALKPNALFVITQTPASGERILKQLGDLNWKPALMINDAISGDPKTVENNKTILEGALAAEFGIDLNNTKFQNMINNYKTKYGEEPPFQSYAQTEYDAVYIIKEALMAVGNDGAKIADWFRTVSNWDGASGKVTIGSDGDRVGGHTLKVVKNGKVEVVQ